MKMLCRGNKRRVAIPFLWILLILKVCGGNSQTPGSLRYEPPVESLSPQIEEFTTLNISDENAIKRTSIASKVHDCFRFGLNIAEKLEKWLEGKSYEPDKSKLFMRSRKMNERKDLAKADLSNLKAIDFDIRRKTFFIIHGYMSNTSHAWIPAIEDALLQLEDANVVSVDWSQKFMAWNYLKSVAITENVGNQIATFLQNVSAAASEKQGITKDNWGLLHFIGHSLGAHISGFTASELKRRQVDWQIHRISGLDPAKPCFDKEVEENLKLDSGDAPFVDVIHTDADALYKGGVSLFEPIGHFDFYPNGGKRQSGCSKIQLPDDLPHPIKLLKKLIERAICNHNRASMYFLESIVNSLTKNCTFWSMPWDLSKKSANKIKRNPSCNGSPCVEMGINSESYYRGNDSTFYVLTADKPPYCIVRP